MQQCVMREQADLKIAQLPHPNKHNLINFQFMITFQKIILPKIRKNGKIIDKTKVREIPT